MTSWAEVCRFVEENFVVSFPTENCARVSFSWDDGRSHTVDIEYREGPEPLLRLSAPITELDGVNIPALLEVLAGMAIPYGVGIHSGPYGSLNVLGLVHVMLLDGLTGDSLEVGLVTLAEFADVMEDAVTSGGDDFVAEAVLGKLLQDRLSGGV